MNKHDLILIGIVLATAALLFWGFAQGNSKTQQIQAAVYLEDGLIATIPLNQDTTAPLPHLPQLQYQVSKGGIAITRADCPDQVCVKTGGIKKMGQAIVCIPNRLLIKITPPTASVPPQNFDDELDGVVY